MKSFLAILAVSVISVTFCWVEPKTFCETDAYCQDRGWESCKLMPNRTYGICQGLISSAGTETDAVKSKSTQINEACQN
ncbi:unnamed protein product, partial [Mesorhabditis belari]|uniref:Uncharacterized protein n=1 Tax=Mesorhabditis belari TaxID=2138241 RepID=A0AAF3J8V2_9BILA